LYATTLIYGSALSGDVIVYVCWAWHCSPTSTSGRSQEYHCYTSIFS